MNYYVLTLFPEMIRSTVDISILGRAKANGLINVETVNIRDYSANKHNRVDDYPYGGGAGMVMEAEPVYRAVESVKAKLQTKPRVVYLTPQGRVLNQTIVEELAMEENLILLCGHYEGIDERVLQEAVTDYISIGDYVLTGGELGAAVLIDAISRFVPGVLNNQESAWFESMQDNLLEYPHYTRPEIWHEMAVPEILLSGDHKKIEDWRHEKSLERTKERRPDLLARSVRYHTIFYGTDIPSELPEKLTKAVTRYGEILDYNRRKLQKTRLSFGPSDVILFILGQDDPASTIDFREAFRNLKGRGTLLYFLSGRVPPDSEILLLEKGFLFAGTYLLTEQTISQEEEMSKIALEIRKKTDKMLANREII